MHYMLFINVADWNTLSFTLQPKGFIVFSLLIHNASLITRSWRQAVLSVSRTEKYMLSLQWLE